MNITRTLAILARDIRLSLRSPVFLGVSAIPFVITAVTWLNEPKLWGARVGIVDHGDSQITAALEKRDDILLSSADSADELRTLVENHDVDAGLVLPDGFDEKVRAGERPDLVFHLSAESFMTRRVVLAVTAVDLIRQVENRKAPVNVVVDTVGGRTPLPITRWQVLFATTFVLMTTGMFVPALMLVEERERGTLSATLVTPARVAEVLVSRALLGLVMTMAMSYLTLVLNLALPPKPSALLITIALAAVMSVEMGLIVGTLAKDAQSVCALASTLQIFIVTTMMFCVGPRWAQLSAKFIPTYWFIGPLYRIAVDGAELADVQKDLVVGFAIAVVMLVPLVLLGRRMQWKLATA